MSYSNSGGDEVLGCLVSAVFLALCVSFTYVVGETHRIIPEIMTSRFETLTGADRVEIAEHSNASFVTGNRHDVSFELLAYYEDSVGADSVRTLSGRCTSGYFSPIICRAYTP